MKATVTIAIDVEDLGDLEHVERFFRNINGGTGGQAPVAAAANRDARRERLESATIVAEPEPPKKKRGPGRPRKVKPEPVKVKPEPASSKTPDTIYLDEEYEEVDLDEVEVETKPATEDDLRLVVKPLLDAHQIDFVREVFQTFKSKGGKSCKTLSDVKPKDRAAIIAKLESVEV